MIKPDTKLPKTNRRPIVGTRPRNTDDLVRRLCHALTIADRATQRLADHGYIGSEAQPITIQPEKVISETGFLLLAVSAAAFIPEVKTALDTVAQRLIPFARSSRMSLGMCLEPSLALDYAQAHICLTKLGYPDEHFDTLLRQCLSAQAAKGKERMPHRTLEQQWIAETWDAHATYNSTAVAQSVLQSPVDLFSGSRDDVYAFTHALMYVTDSRLRPRRLPRSRGIIMNEAQGMLARCLDAQDYDLGGEVLLAWPLTGAPWNPAALFGFRVLTAVEDAAGFLPSPATRLDHLAGLHGAERTDYMLASAYHTAYVMGLLCAASLRGDRVPSPEIPIRAGPSGAAAQILTVLDTDQREVHWRHEFDQLSVPQQDALAGMLLDIALYRKVHDRAFDTVRSLLLVGQRYNLIDSMASQAAELLERLTFFAREEGNTASPISRR